MTGLIGRLRRRWQREDGTATMEFMFMVPVVIMLFISTFEAGLLMIRSLMLERGVDMAMRELRLGHIENPDLQKLKEEICKFTVILKDCEASMMLELRPISKANWQMPTVSPTCVDRDEEINPPTFQPGSANEVMLVRACILQNIIFPTARMGARLTAKEGGKEYGIVASSAFVNEP